MSTIINTPPAPSSDNSGTGLVVGILIALVFAGLFFVYLLPQIRGANTATPPKDTTIKVELPAPPAPVTPKAN